MHVSASENSGKLPATSGHVYFFYFWSIFLLHTFVTPGLGSCRRNGPKLVQTNWLPVSFHQTRPRNPMWPVVTPQILSQTHETDFNGAKYAVKFALDPVSSGCSVNKFANNRNLLANLNLLTNLQSAKQIANLLTNLLTNCNLLTN